MKVLHVFTLFTTADSFFNGQFEYLSDCGHEIHVASTPGNDILKFCKKNKVKFFPLKIARSIDINTDLKSIRSLIKLIIKEKYNAIFGHTPKGALVAMVAGWLCRVPVRVYYRHGVIYTTAFGFKRFLFKNVERITSYLATNIINVSQSLNELAIADNLNNQKKQLIIGKGTCGGIDTINHFNPRLVKEEIIRQLKEKFHFTNQDFIIGFCGRVCKDKGIVELIDGFNLFAKQNPHISPKLLIIGGYDHRDILSNSVKNDIENNSNIIFVGPIPHDSLPNYYSLMDVFVFPSYREGFGMAVLEASAMEIPILVSRSIGCINSIIEEITGKYTQISPKGICEGIEKFARDKNRKQYGIAGRKWVTENFEQSIMWPQIAEYYSKLDGMARFSR